MQTQIRWIDMLRGICMLAILLDHTELYMTGTNIIPYMAYVTNALIIFFCLSGYLMYKPERLHAGHKFRSICRSLVMPYVIFSILIHIPKQLIRHEPIDLPQLLLHIVTGQTSWFIAALIVAECIFVALLRITNEKPLLCGLGATGCLVVSVFLSHDRTIVFWQFPNALQAVFFLYTGYLYHRFEPNIARFTGKPTIYILLIIYVALKLWGCTQGIEMTISPIHISHYPYFLTDMLVSLVVMTGLCRQIKTAKWLEWVGRTSIIYYFISGGVPMLVSMFFGRIGLSYHQNYGVIIAAFVVVCVLSTVITWAVFRYIPIITGRTSR